MIPAVRWEDGRLVLLDQRYLPERIEYVHCRDFREMASAIKDMVVRGAPAIGITGGYAVAAAVRECKVKGLGDRSDAIAACEDFLREASGTISSARPTAVNLMWAVDRVLGKALDALRREGSEGLEGYGAEAPSDHSLREGHPDQGPSMAKGGERQPSLIDKAYAAALAEARLIEQEDVEMNRRIGAHGAELIRPGSRVLTHCNAGALATGGYGTALGVIRKAWEQKKISMVYADETRPYLQGARLTAWELMQDGIDVTILVDSAAGYLISRGMVDCVIVGADRIARNGDVANKIGTYTLACLAHIHKIPFYVAAPTSTFDLTIPDMSAIPVEERAPEEVLSLWGTTIGPRGAKAFNPAFDLTPSSLISGIITEKGVIFPPIRENLAKIVSGDDVSA